MWRKIISKTKIHVQSTAIATAAVGASGDESSHPYLFILRIANEEERRKKCHGKSDDDDEREAKNEMENYYRLKSHETISFYDK